MRGVAAGVVLAGLVIGFGMPLRAEPGPSDGSPSGAAVLIDVSVTDSDGHPVRGLTAADFEVTEDGRPIADHTVTAVDITDSAPDGRSYLIGVDALHLTPRGAATVRPLIDRFVTQFLGPHDRAAILSIGQAPALSPLTGDRQLLLRASGVASTAALNASAARRNVGLSFAAPGDIEHAGVRAFAALARATAEALHARDRRTAILFISEGIPLDGRNSRETIDAQRAFFAAAARANAIVYPIDPVGMSDVASGIEPSEESEPSGLSELDSLRAIAGETGGRLVMAADVAAAYRQIVQNSSSYYVISYVSPSAAKRAGEYHKIRVQPKNRSLRATTRKGWYEPK